MIEWTEQLRCSSNTILLSCLLRIPPRDTFARSDVRDRGDTSRRFKYFMSTLFCSKVLRTRDRWLPRGRDRRGKIVTCVRNTAGPGPRFRAKCTIFQKGRPDGNVSFTTSPCEFIRIRYTFYSTRVYVVDVSRCLLFHTRLPLHSIIICVWIKEKRTRSSRRSALQRWCWWWWRRRRDFRI